MANRRKTYTVCDLNTGKKILIDKPIEDIAYKLDMSVGHLRRKASDGGYFMGHYYIRHTGSCSSSPKTQITYKLAIEMHHKYINGTSLEQLATEYNCNTHSLKKAFKECGWSVRDYRQAQELRKLKNENTHEKTVKGDYYSHYFDRKIADLGKVKALRNAGWSKEEIAEEFLSNVEEVDRCLKTLGMK